MTAMEHEIITMYEKEKAKPLLDIKTLLLFFRVSFNLGVPFQEAVI